MAKAIYHGKSHGVWVLPCDGLSHGSMAKAMDIVKGDIHGFCHCLLKIFMHGEIPAVQKFQPPTCLTLRFDMIGTKVTLNITTAEQLTGQTLLILHLRPEMRV